MGARIITFHYTLTDPDGKQLDSSQGGDPLSFMEGSGQIIPGLEAELGKLGQGDKSQIGVAAKDAYGERQAENVLEVPRDKLPAENVKVGDQFRAGQEPNAPVVTVTEVGDQAVKLDGNHPLAGIDLKFDVEVTEIRDATEEEIAHGHAHGPGGHHH